MTAITIFMGEAPFDGFAKAGEKPAQERLSCEPSLPDGCRQGSSKNRATPTRRPISADASGMSTRKTGRHDRLLIKK
jgi:hypothetical protein